MALATNNDLTRVPSLSFALIEEYIQGKSRSAGSSQLNKGFKYYSEGYIFNLKTFSDDDLDLCCVTAKCYRSQRRNESPHDITVNLSHHPIRIADARCSCAIGASMCCGHVTGVLYLTAHYKLRGLKVIPQDVAKTSMPQTWHLPRGEKIHGMLVQDVEVVGYKKDGDSVPHPVKSTLYNPIRTPLPPLTDFFSRLSDSHPSASILSTVPLSPAEYPTLIQTPLGLFHKGSTISHQQQLPSSYLLNIVTAHFPDLPLNTDQSGENTYSTVLSNSQLSLLESLAVTQEEAVEIEKATRLQSADKKWGRLRVHRVTASKVGEIAKRQKDPEKYAQSLRTPSRIVTEAMKLGVLNEPVAVAAYSKIHDKKINIYPSGIVISPKTPWMAATPDRKVFDASSDKPYGLLEIKCPDLTVKDLKDLPYLSLENGQLHLKRNSNYYCQIQMQMAMSGLTWCDFFIWSQKATHLERIEFRMDVWQEIKNKADKFYFDFILQ